MYIIHYINKNLKKIVKKFFMSCYLYQVGTFVNRFCVRLHFIIAGNKNGFRLRCRFFFYNHINTIIILLFNCIALISGLDIYITPDHLGLLPQPKLVWEVGTAPPKRRPIHDFNPPVPHNPPPAPAPPPNNNNNNNNNNDSDLFGVVIYSILLGFFISAPIYSWLFQDPVIVESEFGDFKLRLRSWGMEFTYEPGAAKLPEKLSEKLIEKLPENLTETEKLIEKDKFIVIPDGEEKLPIKK